MKVWKQMLILLGLWALATSNAAAQMGPWQLQANLGVLSTAHYGRPIPRLLCIEGCPVTEQQARLAPTWSVGVTRLLGSRHAVYLAVGASELRFHEKGFISPGDPTLIPYAVDVRYRFYQLQIGHRLQLLRLGDWPLLLTNGLMAERTRDQDNTPLSLNNLSYAAKLGTIWGENRRVSLALNASFRTAITNYHTDVLPFNAYRPFGVGLEAAVIVNL